ncbi:MAG: hypothetical protein Q8O19_02845 [Rectinemataceae bacterium]|nr:hypothetical protein [Rectinemataceae bacterium]
MKKSLAALSVILAFTALTACNAPSGAYVSRGQPESLLDYSSERVSLSLSSPKLEEELMEWVGNDRPSRAEISCTDSAPGCGHAKDILNKFGISYKTVPGNKESVALIYEKIVARDCESRYVDNNTQFGSLRLNHPTFGCSTAANMVQMVGNRKQFTNPPLQDAQDAERSAKVFGKYLGIQK